MFLLVLQQKSVKTFPICGTKNVLLTIKNEANINICAFSLMMTRLQKPMNIIKLNKKQIKVVNLTQKLFQAA